MNIECKQNCPKIQGIALEHDVDYAERHGDPRLIATSLSGRTHYEIDARIDELAENCPGIREITLLRMLGISFNTCQSPDK